MDRFIDLEAGTVKIGDHVHYVKFIETWGRLYEVRVKEVLYPGTTHERIRGETYDVDDGQFTSHEVPHGEYWSSKLKAVAQVRIRLVHEMQQLRAQAMSLGFFLK